MSLALPDLAVVAQDTLIYLLNLSSISSNRVLSRAL